MPVGTDRGRISRKLNMKAAFSIGFNSPETEKDIFLIFFFFMPTKLFLLRFYFGNLYDLLK